MMTREHLLPLRLWLARVVACVRGWWPKLATLACALGWSGPARGDVAENPPAEAVQHGAPTAVANTPAAQPGQPVRTVPPRTRKSSLHPNNDDEMVRKMSIFADGLPRTVGSAHRVNEKTLEARETDDVHRALDSVPGVYVRGEDGYGLRPNIGLRGANSDRSAKVTLMEDGILFAPAPYAAPAAYYFPLMTRIVGLEVFKGPAALRFGPNTIGGAINLQTRPIPQASQGGIDLAVGRFRYNKAHGHWGQSWRRFGLLMEGVHIGTTGFKELDSGGDTGFAKNEAMLKANVHNDENAFLYHEGAIKVGFADERSNETYLGLTDNDFQSNPNRRYSGSQLGRVRWWRTQAQASYLARGDLIEFSATAYRNDLSRGWRKLNRFRAGPEISTLLQHPDAGQSAVYMAVLRGDEDTQGPEQALLIGTNNRRYVSQGLSTVTHIRPTSRFVDQDIELGARVHMDQISRDHTEKGYNMLSGVLVPEATDPQHTAKNRGRAIAGAFYLVDEIRIAERFTVVPGARVEVIYTDYRDRLNPRTSDDLQTVFLPGVGAHVQVTPWLGLLGGVHAGFSPVSPGQADGVKPERSTNYELGGRVNVHGFHGEIIGFFNNYKNLTGECTFSGGCTDAQIGQQVNAGRVFIAGSELVAGYRHDTKRSRYVHASANYTFTWSRFRESFTSSNPQFADVTKGDALPYVPQHLLSVQLGGGGRMWNVYAVGNYMGEMSDLPWQGSIPKAQRIDDYFVLDLSGRVWVTKRASIYTTVSNVTATTYMVSRRPFGARPGLPVSFMIGFKYAFGAL